MASRAPFSWSTVRVASAVAAVAAIAIVVQLALLGRTPPVRCPAGLTLFSARCCGVGQAFSDGRCVGRASACAVNQRFLEIEGEPPGCVFEGNRVPLKGGRLPAGAADWQASGDGDRVEVAPFAIDRGEVTVSRYVGCLRAGACKQVVIEREPGLPVTGLGPDEAARFCAFAGGRLPSSAEWRFAASGREGRRFPWGFTGLVCRRASFGLLNGPCGSGAAGPDLVGARPDGATPEGVVDLAGNVAEWTLDPDGRARARGGSYRSRVAVELMSAAVEVVRARAPHVGFRCAYDAW